jgi:hypothetical protein
MTESTLSLTYDDLANDVAFFLGYGATFSSCTVAQKTQIDKIVQDGYRQFLFPPLTAQQLSSGKFLPHSWSFLNQIGTVTTSQVTGTIIGAPVYSGTTLHSTVMATTSVFLDQMIGYEITWDTSGNSYPIVGFTLANIITVEGDASGELSGDTFTVDRLGDYDLGDDFGGLDGQWITLGDEPGVPGIKVVNEGKIRSLRQQYADRSGRPEFVAVRQKSSDGTTGQRWEMMLFPSLPDDDYVLTYRYVVLVNKLATTKYPLGGMAHADTIRASCLAMAEMDMNDEQGLKYARFMERLTSSIGQDKSAEGIGYLGYNGDRSDGNSVRHSRSSRFMVNGVEFTD